MEARQIQCIVTEADRHGHRAISELRGPGWRLSLEEMMQAIERGEIFFLTLDGESYSVSVGTDAGGRKYLRTALGEDSSSMLLRLRECPA